MARRNDDIDQIQQIRGQVEVNVLQTSQPDRLYEGYIFDLDGTIYLGNEVLPGARRLILTLRELGKRVVFLSNNPTRNREDYATKLTDLGIPTPPTAIVNTVFTMTRWLLRNHPQATVFPISEEPLKVALASAGVRMSEDPAEIDLVIASYDRSFDYRKLQIAFDAIWFHKRARLIATNPDRYCPFPGGRGEPDAAAITAAIEACTGVACELHVGKPDPMMLTTALEVLRLDAKECLMVGDRVSTDIRMALDANMPSALVLTGEASMPLLQATPLVEWPTFVLDRIDRLLPVGIREELGWTMNDGDELAAQGEDLDAKK